MTESTPGSPSWQTLLEQATRLLDRLRVSDWALGGGTVLMLHYAHRTSRDIDVFIKDPQLLPHLSPRLNEGAAAIASDYVEGSSFVKLACAGGEIDFIVAPDLTDTPRETRTIAGRTFALETPVEIAVKKAFYRAADLRTRDVFDLAVVIDRDRAAVARNAHVLAGKARLLRTRLAAAAKRWHAGAAKEIAVLPAGVPYLESAPAIVESFVATLPA
jgi:hypothetical protein